MIKRHPIRENSQGESHASKAFIASWIIEQRVEKGWQ
jgi:hypothetical protein